MKPWGRLSARNGGREAGDLLFQGTDTLSKVCLTRGQASDGEEQGGEGKHEDEHQDSDIDQPSLQGAQDEGGKLPKTGKLEEHVVARHGAGSAEQDEEEQHAQGKGQAEKMYSSKVEIWRGLLAGCGWGMKELLRAQREDKY